MSRRTALVVAPGRGTYNRDELGYLKRHHAGRGDLIERFDRARHGLGQPLISELDGAPRYSAAALGRGDNASGLIYACAYADFQAIDRDRFDIVAVTGNSMGWYIALACGGALDTDNGFHLVNTMGTLMHQALIGGQMLYPVVDAEWREIPGKRDELLALIDATPGLYLSIDLGGMLVFGGEAEALTAAEKHLPPVRDRFPMRLAQHAAFHTPLQTPVSETARTHLGPESFGQPTHPLIDGRGQIWWPKACNTTNLWDYTLKTQVLEPYGFAAALRTGLREFAPEVVIVLGPGSTLGGAVAQTMIAANWHGLADKAGFQARQTTEPVLLSMGLDDQRRLVTG